MKRLSIAAVLAAGLSIAAGAAGQDAPVRDLTLAEALRLAGAASEPITIAGAGLSRAEAEVDRARSQRLPQLTAVGAYTRTLRSEFEDLDFDFGDGGSGGDGGLGDLPFGQENRYDLGFALDQSLWSGGRIGAEVRASEAGRAAAEVGVVAARAGVALEVVAAYFDAALADQILSISTASLAQAERTYAQAKLAFEVGDAAEFDVLRAQVARDNERPQLARRRSDRELAQLHLKQLLDLPARQRLRLVTVAPDAPIATPDAGAPAPPPAADAAAIEAWIERRAPLRQAEAEVSARRELVKVARAARRPVLGLSSDYGRVAYPESGLPAWSDTRDNWTVGVGVSMPLFLGGRLRAEEAIALANTSAAEAELRRLRELATLEALEALERLAAAEEAWSAAQGSVGQAVRAFEIAEVRYREGISTQLELDDARLLLSRAEANRALAARDLQVARSSVALLPDLPLGAVSSALTPTPFPSPDLPGAR